MTRIEIFSAEEKDRTHWWNRLNGNTPRIITMDHYLHKFVKWECEAPVVLKPGHNRLLYTAALLIGWLTVPGILLFSGAPLKNALAPALILFPVIAWGVWYYLFSKKFNFSLRIDQSGIEAKGLYFSWKDIEATCLMFRRGVAGYASILVVLPYNAPAQRYDLAFFSVPDGELAQMIECFRLKGLKNA